MSNPNRLQPQQTKTTRRRDPDAPMTRVEKLAILNRYVFPVVAVFGPVLLAAAVTMGIDPLYFGLVMVLNLMIGLVTPPFGICLFIIADVAEISFARMVKAMVPFYVPLFAVLILLCVCPAVGTWLPSLMMG